MKPLRAAGCTQAIMVGRVQKTKMYTPFAVLRYIPDIRTARMWWSKLRKDKRPNAVLNAIIDELDLSGIHLIDSTSYCTDQLATPGVMTRRQPVEDQWNDIRFGWEICKQISTMDIGQSIAVLDRDVIAVEALEGTNSMIDRAGSLCKVGGWTLIKVANKDQDMRADVPTVGTTTIEKLAAARASCLVLEAGKNHHAGKGKSAGACGAIQDCGCRICAGKFKIAFPPLAASRMQRRGSRIAPTRTILNFKLLYPRSRKRRK